MLHLSKLRATTDLKTFAAVLGVKPGVLSNELFIKPKAALYTKFEIPKRFGGNREIQAPNGVLRHIQQSLAALLSKCASEINESQKLEDFAVPDPKVGASHAFKKNRSIVTNARPHTAKRWVFNVDLQDFFGTINFGRVRSYFIANRHFALHPAVATVIAQIACNDNKLPQGSPCSPIISDLIGQVLDISLVKLARATDCTYTRYADDLTFSSNRPSPSTRVARRNPSTHEWEAGVGLKRSISRAGFRINPAKTRMLYRDSQQVVTGLTVNRKVNVSAPYRNTVRAMAYSLLRTGSFDFFGAADDGTGKKTQTRVPGRPPQLIGMLAHIDYVDRINREFRALHGLEPIDTPGRVELFKRVLYFIHFFQPVRPVIVCEGPTDNIYITCAMKRLGLAYPTLVESGSSKLRVDLFKYSEPTRRTAEVMQIRGGTGGQCNLIEAYSAYLKDVFGTMQPKHPVILLVDNDSGADGVYGKIAGVFSKPKPAGLAPFIHVVSNLYVVPTPKTKGTKTYIEQFFDSVTLATQLNGKSFEPGKIKDNATQYGKMAFALDVVAKNARGIDFSGFAPILARLELAIGDFAKKIAPIAPGR